MMVHSKISADSLTYTVTALYPRLSLIDIILGRNHLWIGSDYRTNKFNDM